MLGVELSQLTNDDERAGLNIERSSINVTGRENGADAGDVRELFRTPTLRRATISMWVIRRVELVGRRYHSSMKVAAIACGQRV